MQNPPKRRLGIKTGSFETIPNDTHLPVDEHYTRTLLYEEHPDRRRPVVVPKSTSLELTGKKTILVAKPPTGEHPTIQDETRTTVLREVPPEVIPISQLSKEAQHWIKLTTVRQNQKGDFEFDKLGASPVRARIELMKLIQQNKLVRAGFSNMRDLIPRTAPMMYIDNEAGKVEFHTLVGRSLLRFKGDPHLVKNGYSIHNLKATKENPKPRNLPVLYLKK